jgi:ketosteroid isomerase-like protein
MSQKNVEIVRRCIEAMNRRDFSQFSELFDPDVEYDLSRNIFNPDVYLGYEGIERLVAVVEDVWDELHGVPEEVIDAGDKVVSALLMQGKGRESGIEVKMRLFQVWSFRGSRVVRVVGGYRDRSDALDAAGLSERDTQEPPDLSRA